jgi:hypothetical protein
MDAALDDGVELKEHDDDDDVPLSRLLCHCVFTESAQRLQRLLDKAEGARRQGAVLDMQRALSALRREHREHVTRHNQEYMRAMLELAKQPVTFSFQTSAYKAGALTALRNPPKKLTKKEEVVATKKRMALQAASGATPLVASKKKKA